MKNINIQDKDLKKFFSKIKFTQNKYDCWEWAGPFNEHGYGVLCYYNRKRIYAHRLAYFVANGRLKIAFYINVIIPLVAILFIYLMELEKII